MNDSADQQFLDQEEQQMREETAAEKAVFVVVFAAFVVGMMFL
jgi:hypothetical protein